MLTLTPENVQLRARAKDRETAIRAAGRVLVESGAIAPGYVESMVGRERQANTYLGNGIAIPHGMAEDRGLIHRTDVSVVQFPEGVEWNGGQTVRLVVGIAAKSDEHLGILAALTDVLDDPELSDRLARTDDPAAIIAGLTRGAGNGAGSAPSGGELAGARDVTVKMQGDAGLHARPAAAFVKVASQFASDIQVQHGDRFANGKAMASLLKLSVTGGQTVRILAAGLDAAEALRALREAVENGLGEGAETADPVEALPAWKPGSSGQAVSGVPASPGLAIGQLYQFQTTRVATVVKDEPKGLEFEKTSLRQALEIARQELAEIYEGAEVRLGKNAAAIFCAHQAFLDDRDLHERVLARIDAGHSAAWSWHQSLGESVAEVEQIQDGRLAGRAIDLRDVGQRVLRLLDGAVAPLETHLPDEPAILIAEDLTPSDTARLDPKRILGLCTAAGGPTSHTAIIARALDIPAIVGAGAGVLEKNHGQECILDGTAGRLYVEPSAADLASARAFQIDLRRQRDKDHQTRYEPAILTDGHRVEVVANIGQADEAALAVEAGAEGIGLLRTEFLFLGRDTPPSEEEQFVALCTMIEALNGLPLIVRTLDIGGDKVLPYLTLPKEENPFLGVRGIRLCLQRPELFLPQLRAIYRASVLGPVKIMFPMVATLEDLRAAKEIAERVRAETGVPPVEIGIMIEVPSTVMMADELAQETDFFSIGTNDLTQYALAIDRMHPVLGKQADALHPAVLRMIDLTVRAAKSAGKWVGVCGGLAGDPLGAAILTGLGVAELSMGVPSLAVVKAALRRIQFADAETLAKKALACKTAAEVRQLSLPRTLD